MPIMKKAKPFSAKQSACPLSIEQLEAGLRVMSNQTTDPDVFWDENVEAFRRTALHAIRPLFSGLVIDDHSQKKLSSNRGTHVHQCAKHIAMTAAALKLIWHGAFGP